MLLFQRKSMKKCQAGLIIILIIICIPTLGFAPNAEATIYREGELLATQDSFILVINARAVARGAEKTNQKKAKVQAQISAFKESKNGH